MVEEAAQRPGLEACPDGEHVLELEALIPDLDVRADIPSSPS